MKVLIVLYIILFSTLIELVAQNEKQHIISIETISVNGLLYHIDNEFSPLPEHIEFGDHLSITGRVYDNSLNFAPGVQIDINDGLSLMCSFIRSTALGYFTYNTNVSNNGIYGPKNISMGINTFEKYVFFPSLFVNFDVIIPNQNNLFSEESFDETLLHFNHKYDFDFSEITLFDDNGELIWGSALYVPSIHNINSLYDVNENNYFYVIQAAEMIQATNPFFLRPEIVDRAYQIRTDIQNAAAEEQLYRMGPGKLGIYIGSGLFCASTKIGNPYGPAGCVLLFKTAVSDVKLIAIKAMFYAAGASKEQLEIVDMAYTISSIVHGEGMDRFIQGAGWVTDKVYYNMQIETSLDVYKTVNYNKHSPYHNCELEEIIHGLIYKIKFDFELDGALVPYELFVRLFHQDEDMLIDSGIQWLRAHQHTDGYWAGHNGDLVGTTSLALQVLLAAGYEPQNDPAVDKGIQYLLSQQKSNGAIYNVLNQLGYQSAMAITALRSAVRYNPPNSKEIHKAINDAQQYYISNQSTHGGWRYRPHQSNEYDLSVSQWVHLALEGIQNESLWESIRNNLHNYHRHSNGGFRYDLGSNPTGTMTAAGIWGEILSGGSQSNINAAFEWLKSSYNGTAHGIINAYHNSDRTYYYIYTLAKALALEGRTQLFGEDWYEILYDRLNSLHRTNKSYCFEEDVFHLQTNISPGKIEVPVEIFENQEYQGVIPDNKKGGMVYWRNTSSSFETDALATALALLSLQTGSVPNNSRVNISLSSISKSMNDCFDFTIFDEFGNAAGRISNEFYTNIPYSGWYLNDENTFSLIIYLNKSASFNTTIANKCETTHEINLSFSTHINERVTDTNSHILLIAPNQPIGTTAFVNAIGGLNVIITSPPAAIPIMSITPEKITLGSVENNHTYNFSFTIAEQGGEMPLVNIDLFSRGLMDEFGNMIPSTSITFSPSSISEIPAGGSQLVQGTLTTPASFELDHTGFFLGTITAQTNQQARAITLGLGRKLPPPCNLQGVQAGQGVILTWENPGTCSGYEAIHLYEDFEGPEFPPPGWATIQPDGYPGWTRIAAGTSPVPGWTGGTAVPVDPGSHFMAYATWNTGGPTYTDQWLITPQVIINPNEYITFWLRYDPPTFPDKLDVLISTGSQTNPNDFNTVVASLQFDASSSTEWTRYSYLLTDHVAPGTPFYVAFREHVPDNENMGSALFLDRILIGDGIVTIMPISASGITNEQTATDSSIKKFNTTLENQKPLPVISPQADRENAEYDSGYKGEPIPGLAKAFEKSPNTLFDNGPLVTHAGAGPGGADLSILQTQTLGMNTFGYGAARSSGLSIADEFTVDDRWIISNFEFFAYQTGSGQTSTFSAAYVRIYDGNPTQGGNVIWGDFETNRMVSTSYTNIFRVSEGNLADITRPIMTIVCETPGLILFEGTYWVEYTLAGTIEDPASGPWVPPIAITGQITTGNALQNQTGNWVSLVDRNTETAQGVPFIIKGATSQYAKPVAFRLYRNGIKLTEVSSAVFSFTDMHPPAGINNYFATAVYNYPNQKVESDQSNRVTKIIEPVPATLPINNRVLANNEQHCFNATQTIITGGANGPFTAQQGSSANLIAGQNIIMKPGTHFQAGSHVHAWIAPGGPFCNDPAKEMLAEEDGHDTLPEDEEETLVNTHKDPADKATELILNARTDKSGSDLFFRVFPNPTPGRFTLELSGMEYGEKVTAEVFGIRGEHILREEIPTGQSQHQLSLDGHLPGIYFIRVVSGQQIGIQRIVKQ